jgi:hypothetical protein
MPLLAHLRAIWDISSQSLSVTNANLNQFTPVGSLGLIANMSAILVILAIPPVCHVLIISLQSENQVRLIHFGSMARVLVIGNAILSELRAAS